MKLALTAISALAVGAIGGSLYARHEYPQMTLVLHDGASLSNATFAEWRGSPILVEGKDTNISNVAVLTPPNADAAYTIENNTSVEGIAK